MGFSPANQIMSPYSDGFDSCGESPLSDGGMSEIFKPMGFFDVKDDEHIHDQLPSVEEAKANITEGSHVVTYHSTNSACRRLASEFGWDLAFVDEV